MQAAVLTSVASRNCKCQDQVLCFKDLLYGFALQVDKVGRVEQLLTAWKKLCPVKQGKPSSRTALIEISLFPQAQYVSFCLACAGQVDQDGPVYRFT